MRIEKVNRQDAETQRKAESGKMKIKALAPWFGGKRTLAPRIVTELGEHRAYWEPFCGSLAVLLVKPQATMETVNDLHGDLINLARVIKSPELGPKLYRRLRRTLMAKDLYEAARLEILAFNSFPSAGASIERAYAYFMVAWLGRNGVAGTATNNAGYCKRYTKNGGHAAKRFVSAVETIPAWRRRMRNVTILNEDGFALLERIEDADGVVIYVDPPYIVKGAKYVHDFEATNHEQLAELLRRFKRTRVVVSYYDHPLLAELYPDWTKVDCAITKALVNQGARDKGGAVKAPEVLLINGPSYSPEAGLFGE